MPHDKRNCRPHPYSEAADHERREREDPRRAAKGIIRPALIALGLAIMLGLATCTAFGQQFYYRTDGGNQDRIDVIECTGGALFPALLQFNAWYSNGTWVRLSGEVHSVCTVLIAYPNVTWTRRASFSFHAVTVGDDVASDATRSLMTVYGPDFIERMPARLLACLPPPRDWSERYITIEADEMTRILDTGECPGDLRRPG
ncbi:hypothetical protein ABWI01_03270 [Oceanicaulis alexandrii]|uniref:hypothetical protein n=1 Tax=Oceanicaulis alexandrii TaxID=153233 RepID=UPI0035D0651E